MIVIKHFPEFEIEAGGHCREVTLMGRQQCNVTTFFQGATHGFQKMLTFKSKCTRETEALQNEIPMTHGMDQFG